MKKIHLEDIAVVINGLAALAFHVTRDITILTPFESGRCCVQSVRPNATPPDSTTKSPA